jgi:hypothetical protein
VVEQCEHPVRVQRKDVDSCVQLSLEVQEWQEPARFNFLSGIPVGDERCVVATVNLHVIGTIGICPSLRAGLAIIGMPPSVQLRKQRTQGGVIQDLASHSDATKGFEERLCSMSKGRSEVCADEPRLVTRAVEAKEQRPEQLATRLDRTKDGEDLALVDGCVL